MNIQKGSPEGDAFKCRLRQLTEGLSCFGFRFFTIPQSAYRLTAPFTQGSLFSFS